MLQLIKVKVMRGPNYWDVNRHKLIVLLAKMPESGDIDAALVRKVKGYVHRMYPEVMDVPFTGSKSAQLAQLTGMLAAGLQAMAGLKTSWLTIGSAGLDDHYHIVFEYETPKAGTFAADAAIKAINTMMRGERYRSSYDIMGIRDIASRERLGPSTYSIVKAAADRGIPMLKVEAGRYIQLGYGSKQKRIVATITGQSSNIAVDIAGNKNDTKNLLAYFDIPVPKGVIIYNRHELKAAIDKIGYPVVIKPLNGNQGKGATINVTDWKCALGGLLVARKYSKAIIVEKYVQGNDYRLLVINNKLVAAAMRTPANIVGDGKSTIKQLIEQTNEDPRRGDGHENVLTKIKVDSATRRILIDRKLKMSTVLPEGERLLLKHTANLSTGGTSEDVTDIVHPENVAMAEEIARIVGLDVIGIDVMATDITMPIKETGGAVLEVNAAPGFRMHTDPAFGKPRDVGGAVVDMLFPEREFKNTPIIAVTGTNGKTTTTRLIAHITAMAGLATGYTNTDGIYINGVRKVSGDCSGPDSAEFVLKHPGVECAVLECARGGILRSGLAFNKCGVGVVTNVTSDHLGLEGIDTMEKLARVKAVVPKTVMPSGYAVLNADDNLVYAMAEGLECNVAMFSIEGRFDRIEKVLDKGGMAAVLEGETLVLYKVNERIIVSHVDDVPITLGGRAPFMIANALAAVLAGVGMGLPIESIRKGLSTFDTTSVPGRMNFYKHNGLEILLDYAHNPDGLAAISKFLQHVHKHKVGVVTAVGDRRDDDIRIMGELSAQMFDDLIIRLDRNLRDRKADELVGLLVEGIHKIRPGYQPVVVHNEVESARYALTHAPQGSFVTILSDKHEEVTKFIRDFISKEQELEQV